MATPIRVGQLLQLTEVIQTDATCDNCFVTADASTACRKNVPFRAAVEDTDRCSGQPEV